jgi:hypothetical protein
VNKLYKPKSEKIQAREHDGDICHAQPRTIKGIRLFKPTAAHTKAFYETPGYMTCPKYVTYVAHINKAKEEKNKPKTCSLAT